MAAYNQRIMGPSHAANAVDEAIKTTLARRTVAHLTIPKDIQDWTQDETTRSDQNIPQRRPLAWRPTTGLYSMIVWALSPARCSPYTVGVMFWLWRNRFVGSYLRFRSARRW